MHSDGQTRELFGLVLLLSSAIYAIAATEIGIAAVDKFQGGFVSAPEVTPRKHVSPGEASGVSAELTPSVRFTESSSQNTAEAPRVRGEVEECPLPKTFQTNVIEGWLVMVDDRLLAQNRAATEKAFSLLREQLREIERQVPSAAVEKLRQVTLWFSPEYPNVLPTAEYHPAAGWLRENNRNEQMAKGVEFTNITQFEAETGRMPNFTLHELAHAFHDRFLPAGFENSEIQAAYDRAKASGAYNEVVRWNGKGKPNTKERAYAMTNPMEYFAELTECFFSRNDFFPFTRDELHQHDPEMERLLPKLWGEPKE